MRKRFLVFVAALGLAAGLGFLAPRLTSPPDRVSVAYDLMEEGRAHDAVYLFDDPLWRGVAEHRAGRFRRSVGEFLREENALTLYNAGVAYARLHEWGAAKAAFRKTLRLDPDHLDARHNLAVVERAEQAERELIEAASGKDGEAGWEGGDIQTELGAGSGGDKAEEGEASEGDSRAAEAPSEQGGRSASPGLSGERSLSKEAEGGPSVGLAEGEDETAPERGATASAAAPRRESAQAVEILLRRISDDPARVLEARLREAHRRRLEREGQ